MAKQPKTGSNTLKIAVIPGDGIGNEVVPEGIKVLEAVGRRFDLAFEWQHYDWSCEVYKKTGNIRACQLLLGHRKLESTVRYLGIEVDDALELSEQIEL